MRRFATGVFLGAGVVCYGLIVLFARGFFSVFTPGDFALIDFAQSRSLRYFSGFFLAGYNILMITFWQSTQRTRPAMAVSLLRSLVLPPLLVAVLPLLFGREAIWIGHSASEAITAVVAFALLRMGARPERAGKAGVPLTRTAATASPSPSRSR